MDHTSTYFRNQIASLQSEIWQLKNKVQRLEDLIKIIVRFNEKQVEINKAFDERTGDTNREHGSD